MTLINEKRTLTDALGRELEYEFPPKRIVSLCPSITETLLILDVPVVGRTRYCIHPAEKVDGISEVGGTKKLRFEDIDALEPDLIIAEKEENRQQDVEQLSGRYPVYVCDVVDIASALKMIPDLGNLCGAEPEAETLHQDIVNKFSDINKYYGVIDTGYLIWRNPWMAAGANTYINSVLEHCGLKNVFAERLGRYPEINPSDLRHSGVRLLLLSSEPYPFAEPHIVECRELLPQARILLVDGEMFSWYGARMLKAADYLNDLCQDLR